MSYDDLISLRNVIFLQYLQEERQRALLQLQWKVMSDKPQEDQEVNSKQVGLCNQSLCLSPLVDFPVGIQIYYVC
jgi:hypothetical protein